jgi:hypothetical protein
MNRKQINVVEAASTTVAYLSQPLNAAIVQGNQAIADTLAEINGDLAALAGLEKKQQQPVTGPAADKAALRHDYEEAILAVAGQLAALGAKKNDLTLEAQADLTMTDLEDMAADDLVGAADRIGDLATANLAALAAYNILPATLTALAAFKPKFQALKTKPREAVVGRKQETDLIQPLIKSLRGLLERQLDRQVLTYKVSQPEFYAGYLAARVIVDRGNPAKKKTTPPPAK